MPSIHLNYGNWQFWSVYDPANDVYGDQKVTFDGPNKLVLVNSGVTFLDFRPDVYSAWKEWLLDGNQVNTKYAPAISVIGGDPLPGDRALGTTYFFENGWRMRTWDGDHSLTVIGNVYTREGAPVFVPTLLPVTTTIELVNSTLPETLIPTVSFSNTDASFVSDAVWNKSLTAFNTAGTAGKYIKDTAEDVAAIVIPVIPVPPTANAIADAVWANSEVPVIPVPPTANAIADAVWANSEAPVIPVPPTANAIADAVWANNIAANTATKVDRLIKLAEADEVLTSNTATKIDKDTNEVLLIKNVAGVPQANTTISLTSP